ncbi:MAG: phage major capsid protein [Prevotella sp.]|nr:phage major capsid protein [Alistipes senegalensis]MCM1357117.1 phage major capsid protein [Prevotella sp.]MCM1472561.1 phage major capsid protein [Muribaculaceae bacterium]
MTKLEEMKSQLTMLIKKMQSHLDSNELDKAETVKNEINELRNKIEKQIFIDNLEMPEKSAVPAQPSDSTDRKNVNFIRACIKKFAGRKITESENALLLPTYTGTTPDGEHNEGYILPQDIQTKIHKRIREYKSLRTVCGHLTTTALTGSFPVENLDSLTGLTDFTDGMDATESDDIKFSKLSFSLKEKGALIQLSNTLLALTDNDLMSYIVDIFAKKAIITENTMAIEALNKGKTIKTLTGWQSLKSSINKDLDPASLYNTVIVTNQDGFDFLDLALDTNGRPILQPDPTNPTAKRFAGYPIHVFSNAMFPTKNGKAPIYYGNIEEGVKFVELNLMSFATSSEAGFTRNTTYARLIEFLDVVQNDSSDKCYIAGQLSLTTTATT